MSPYSRFARGAATASRRSAFAGGVLRLGSVQHASHKLGVDQNRRLAEGENPALHQPLCFGIQDFAPRGTLQAPPNGAGGVGFHAVRG